MVVGWVCLMSLVPLGWTSTSFAEGTSASNVTSAYSAFSYNDQCTNQCDDSDNTHWCRERRLDTEGFMSRCVEYTRNGRSCVSRCFNKGQTKYTWCMTNAYVIDSGYTYWEYCSMEGLTINGEECIDTCHLQKPGRHYYKCTISTSWDYCSPPGRVKPLQLNIYGGPCKSECSHYEEDYTWCSKNIPYYKSGVRTWEYCSIDNMHTRYGTQCKDSCSSRGENYYWCHTEDNWDYCSPKAEDGGDFNLKVEFDIYGNECLASCNTHGEDYLWCATIGGHNDWNWDYCSKENMTIYNSPCTDSCSKRGESYHWCHTASSWDYCSPAKYSAGTAAHGSVIILVLGMCAWITA